MLPSVNLALRLFPTKFNFMKLRSTVVKKLSANAPSPASMGWIGVNLELRLKWAGRGGGSSPQRKIIGNEVARTCAVANPIILPSSCSDRLPDYNSLSVFYTLPIKEHKQELLIVATIGRKIIF